MDFDIRLLKDSEFDAWDAFTYATPGGSIFSTAEYLDVLCSCTGDSFSIAAIQREGRFLGGIALYEIRGRWGTVIRPRSLLAHNGFFYTVGDSKYPSRQESMATGLQEAILECVEDRGYASTCIKCRPDIRDVRTFLDRGWQVLPTYSYAITLDNLGSQWSYVDRKTRQLIKRCDGSGIEITEDEDIDSFLELHSLAAGRKGFKTYLSPAAFRKFLSALQEKGRVNLYHARTDSDRSVACQMVLTGGNSVTHTIAAASNSEIAPPGVNPSLRWHVFEKLAAAGYRKNDLTDASLNSVSSFKSKFGGKLELSLALIGPTSTKYRLGSRVEAMARQVMGQGRLEIMKSLKKSKQAV